MPRGGAGPSDPEDRANDPDKETREMSTTGQPDQLPGSVVEFLQSHSTLTLATASSAGIPRAATFLYVNEGPSLYFWTRTSTVIGRNIEQNPFVSFTIDEYTTDLTQTRGIQGSG